MSLQLNSLGASNHQLQRSASLPQLPEFQPHFMTGESIASWRKVKPLKKSYSQSRLPLTVGSINMLDPIVASLTGYKVKTQVRYEAIANAFTEGGVPLVACQEANASSAQIMRQYGYEVLGLDLGPGLRPEYKQDAPRKKGFSWGYLKRSWSGVQLCFDPNRMALNNNFRPTFYAFAPECQKNLMHVFGALWHVLVETAKNVLTPNAWFATAHEIFQALSGPLRTDGVLVTHLRDQQTQKQIIMCVSHIESFDRSIADLQLQAVTARIQDLKHDYPQALIIFAADFNWQVGQGESKQDFQYESILARFKRELNAVTMPMHTIDPTLIGQRKAIDGVFFLPPAVDSSATKVRGASLIPATPDKIHEHFSDHHGVVVQMM